MNVSQALKAVSDGEFLTQEQATSVLGDIVDGETSTLQVAALLSALRTRGETVAELAGFALGMRARVIPVKAQSWPLIDTCGTGGDSSRNGLSTFNISTAATFVAAAAGAKIAKHGNRAISSKSGSADVLESLGIHLNLTPDAIARSIDEIGVGFMFAPNHHPAMKNVGPIRRELGIRTIFNLLGPLTNPAGASRQVMGVPHKKWLRPIAETLQTLGCERAFIVHSRDGLDEFSTCAPTDYIEIRGQEPLVEKTFIPESHEIACLNAKALEGGDAAQNAVIIQQILHDGIGPSADIVCLNAASILIVTDIVPFQGDEKSTWNEAIKLARATISSGAATEKIAHLRAFTEQYMEQN